MGAPSLVQLVDILAITQAGDIDWDAFAARAIERRAAPFVLAALTQAQNLLDAPLPNDTLSWLADATPAMLRRRIAQLSLNDIMRRTQQKPLVNIRQRLVRGIQDRAETARWASDWRGRWRVWKTALQFGRTDTGRMLLGK